MTRTISYSEVSTAEDCQAAHAFSYTGHLTGGQTLKPRATAPRLSAGTAWGAGVAAYHSFSDGFPVLAVAEGRNAISNALLADRARQEAAGFVDEGSFEELEALLYAELDHYVELAIAQDPHRLAAQLQPVPIKMTRLEKTLTVAVPSRSGLMTQPHIHDGAPPRRRKSSKYRFLSKIDGWFEDEDGLYGPPGAPWIVEIKHRDRLQPVWLMERARQYRWYAWSYEQVTGVRPHGILIDERVHDVPKEPRLVKAKRKSEGIDGMAPSHAKDQLCTAEDYIALCAEYGVEPEPEAVEHMRQRRWQQRVPIEFRPSELEEAGRELASAAAMVGRLDRGEDYPLRNAKQSTCNSCRFKDICPTPDDDFIVDMAFDRRTPKRLLPPKEGH